jgi:hypothetical protein
MAAAGGPLTPETHDSYYKSNRKLRGETWEAGELSGIIVIDRRKQTVDET